jgi:hypothetical protein
MKIITRWQQPHHKNFLNSIQNKTSRQMPACFVYASPFVIYSPAMNASRASLLIRKALPILRAFKSPELIAARISSSETRNTAAASEGVITDPAAGADDVEPPPPALDALPVIPASDWLITFPTPTPAPIPAVKPAPPLGF